MRGVVLYYYWTRGVRRISMGRKVLAALSGSAKLCELDLLNAVAGLGNPSHHCTIYLHVHSYNARSSFGTIALHDAPCLQLDRSGS
jgi:hypothetical protein